MKMERVGIATAVSGVIVLAGTLAHRRRWARASSPPTGPPWSASRSTKAPTSRSAGRRTASRSSWTCTASCTGFRATAAAQCASPTSISTRPGRRSRRTASALRSRATTPRTAATSTSMLVNSDGSDVRRLTSGNFDHREPVWSRDGTRVAFSSDRPTGQFRPPLHDAALGSYNIWSANVATGRAQALGRHPHGRGGRADLVAGRHRDRLRRQQPHRGGQRGGRAAHDHPAAFRPDDQLAVVGADRDRHRLRRHQRQRRPTSGSNTARSPPGRTCSASAGRNGSRRASSCTPPTARSASSTSTPAASRDVAFSATLEMPALSYKKKSYDFDTKKPQQVLGIVTPVLSPDGKQVVFQALNDLWLLDIERRARRR